jgi:hypothetical protein
MMHNETVIYLHIPKTAGTTLHHIIDRQYEPAESHVIDRHDVGIEEFKGLSPVRRARIRMLRGHIPFGLHRYIPGPATYVTVLRDPIERLISYYYFVRGNPKHYLHDYALLRRMTLRRYVESRVSLATDNFQTRIISGAWTNVGYGECDEATLALAQRNLVQHFAVVGLAEQFDQTLLLLKRRFGWRNVFYSRRNVTQGRPPRDSLSQETLAVLRQHNRLDLELYRYAQALFAAQVRGEGARFASVAHTFHTVNRWAQPLLRSYSKAREFSLRVWLRNAGDTLFK